MADILMYLLLGFILYRCWRRMQKNRVAKAMAMMQREYMMTVIAEHPEFAERANQLVEAEAKANMGIVARVKSLIRKLKERQKV